MAKLRQAMRQIENDLETLQSSFSNNNDVKIRPKAINLKSNSSETIQSTLVDSFTNIKNSLISAQWSEFRPWADCFCGRQVRTRICKYDNAYHSSGNNIFLNFKLFRLSWKIV